MFVTQVKSYTKGVTYDVMVSEKYLGKGDKVLIMETRPLSKGKEMESRGDHSQGPVINRFFKNMLK